MHLLRIIFLLAVAPSSHGKAVVECCLTDGNKPTREEDPPLLMDGGIDLLKLPHANLIRSAPFFNASGVSW